MSTNICLCVMMKNESQSIKRCLQSAKSVVDEIVVLDTGSTDNSVEIALSEGAKVYHIDSLGNYNDMRNQCWDYIHHEWVIFLDADECLDPISSKNIRELINQKKIGGYLLHRLNYIFPFGWYSNRQFRLINLNAKPEYVYPIYEGIRIGETWGEPPDGDVLIHHFCDEKPYQERVRKFQSYIQKIMNNYHTSNFDEEYYEELNYLLVVNHALSWNLGKALELCDEQLINSNNASNYFLLKAMIYREMGSMKNVVYNLNKAVINDKSIRSGLYSAYSYFVLQEFEKCKDILISMLDSKDLSAAVYYNLAIVSDKLNQPQEAKKYLELCNLKNPMLKYLFNNIRYHEDYIPSPHINFETFPGIVPTMDF